MCVLLQIMWERGGGEVLEGVSPLEEAKSDQYKPSADL